MEPYQTHNFPECAREDNAYKPPLASSPPRPDSGCSIASGEECPDEDSRTSSDFYKDHTSPVLEEQLFTIGNSARVTVSHVVGPDKFWCQLSRNAHRLKTLMEDLQIYYAHNKPLPPSGSACVVRHPDSGLWHRGSVVKIQSFPYVEVQFVDYGQTYRVMHQDLRPLDGAFATLKCQAFQCRLVDVTCPSTLTSPEWGEPAVSKFYTFLQSAGSSGLTCMIYGVMYDPDGVVVNLVDLVMSLPLDQSHSASTSIAEKPSKCLVPEMKVGSEEKIYVTCVKDVHSFYGQLVRHASEIDKLNEEIQSICNQLQDSECTFSPGDPCFAKYSDGQWYRGLVRKTQPIVMIHFLDYGDIVPVKPSDLRPVPDQASEIASVPIQAVEFSLANAPAVTVTEVSKWFDTNATGNRFTAKVVGKYPDGKCTVELFDGKFNINQAVKEKIWRTGCSSLRAPHHSGLPKSHDLFALRKYETSVPGVSPMGNDGPSQQVVSTSQSQRRGILRGNENGQYDGTLSVHQLENLTNESKHEVFRNTRAIEWTQRTVKESVAVCVTAPSYYAGTAGPTQAQLPVLNSGICNSSGLYCGSFPKLANFPHPPITSGVVAEVYISHVNTVDSLFVQLLQDEDKIHSLVEGLNAGQPCDDPVDFITLQEGDVVAAMYSEDESWYRAAVKKVNEDESILVEFIDFGNRATITSKMVRHLKNFLDTPRLSVHCSLEDVHEQFPKTSDDEKTKQLKSIAKDLQRITCMFINWSGLVWSIVFLDPETKQRRSLSSLAGTSSLSTGNHPPDTLTAPTSGMLCPSQPYSKHLACLTGLPSKPIRQGVPTDVYISHVNSTDSFFVQLAEDGDRIRSLVEEMNAKRPCSQPVVNVRTLQEGDVVAAMYTEDESWYRAAVKKVNEDESLLVEFIDFGNEANIRSTMVRTLTTKHLDIPRLSIQCFVEFGSGCLNSASKEELATKLRGYTHGGGVKVSCIFAVQADHVWQVIFEEPDSALKSNPVAIDCTADITNYSYQDPSTDIPNLSKLSLEAIRNLKDLPHNAITPGVATEVYVSHVNSLASFYVQLVKYEDDLHSLVEKLNSDNPCDGLENVRTLQEGDVVAAMYPEDESWYRAVIKKVNENESYLVEFIDFGNESTVTSDKMACLEKSLLNVPKFSVHCCVKDGSSLPADELIGICNEALCTGSPRKLSCVFIGKSDDVWEVQNLV